MGQRIIIKVLDLLKAGCLINQRIVYHPADEGCEIPEWQEQQLIVYFPQHGEPFGFDFIVDEDEKLTAEADYNEWGSLWPRLKPLLEAFHVDHTIC